MADEISRDVRCEPPRLGTLEQQVMDVLWDEGASSIRQIIVLLGERHAYTTIATVLGNLEKKCLVMPKRDGRSVHYEPRCTREFHAARLMEQALSTSNDRLASIMHFIDTIDPRDAELLRDYLSERGDRG